VISALPDGTGRLPAADGSAISPYALSSPDGRYLAWLTESFGTAVADLLTGTTERLAPPGVTPVRFEADSQATLRVMATKAHDPDVHYYDIDIEAPGRPHTRLPSSVPDGPQQPTLLDVVSSLPRPVVLTYDDPDPPFQSPFAPDDPWDRRRTAAHAAASSDRAAFTYTAIAFAGLRSVSYSLGRRLGHGRCAYFTGRHFLIRGQCGRIHFRRIASAAAWKRSTRRLPHGTYEVRFRAVDHRGRRSRSHRARIVRL